MIILCSHEKIINGLTLLIYRLHRINHLSYLATNFMNYMGPLLPHGTISVHIGSTIYNGSHIKLLCWLVLSLSTFRSTHEDNMGHNV